MSLKAIELDPFLLAGLYTQPLIPEIKEGKESSGTPQGGSLPALGNNRQSILLLIHNPDEPYLEPSLFDLLVKILKACRYSLDDVALVNTAQNDVDWFRLQSQFIPHRIVLFGNALPDLTQGKKANESWSTDGCSFLLADSLASIAKNVSIKTLFWKALQSFFSLNK